MEIKVSRRTNFQVSKPVTKPINKKLEIETGIFWNMSIAVRRQLKSWEERNHALKTHIQLGSNWLKSKLMPLKAINDGQKTIN